MSASFKNQNAYWLPNYITSKEPHPIELPVYHAEFRYGGTFDWAGYWRGDDTLWLLDFKTSDKAKTQKHVLRHSIQLAAYAMALESMTGLTVDRAGILIGRPSGAGQKFLFDVNQVRLARSMWKTRVEQYYANQAAIAVVK